MKCFQAPAAPLLSLSEAESQGRKTQLRNPLLLGEAMEPEPLQRFSKARVPLDVSHTRYLAERPRGVGRAEYSASHQGSSEVGKDFQLEFTPARKTVAVPSSDREKVSRRNQLLSNDSRNPILQQETCFEPAPVRPRTTQDWRPSPVTEYTNERKCMLPSELGLAKPELYQRRNQSSVFDEEAEELPHPTKRIISRPSEAPSVLQYKYALPYRDQTVSDKPQHMLPDSARV